MVGECMECGNEFVVNERAKGHYFCTTKCRVTYNRREKGVFYFRKKGSKIIKSKKK